MRVKWMPQISLCLLSCHSVNVILASSLAGLQSDWWKWTDYLQSKQLSTFTVHHHISYYYTLIVVVCNDLLCLQHVQSADFTIKHAKWISIFMQRLMEKTFHDKTFHKYCTVYWNHGTRNGKRIQQNGTKPETRGAEPGTSINKTTGTLY